MNTLKEAPVIEKIELKQADRCDRCGAQAFAAAHKIIDGKPMSILLCGHHARELTPELIVKGFSIQDETHRINAKPSSTENKPNTKE